MILNRDHRGSLRLRSLAVAGALVCAVGLGACGDSLDGNVAKVDKQSISQETFDHWMKIIAISSAAQQGAGDAGTVVAPDPPDFEKCVAFKRKTAPEPAKGQPETTDAQLLSQCRTEYGTYRDQVVAYLVQATWLDQEAAERNVKLTDAELKKSVDDARAQSGLSEDDAWQKFLAQSGMTAADIQFQQRVSLLGTKLTEAVTKGKDKVTDAQVRAFFDKNKASFGQPERRDLRIILASSKERAEQARSALAAGQSWNAVAKRFSTDPTTKDAGGKLEGVTKEQQDPDLGEAAFAAKKGVLTGPIESQFGFYVFEVTKIARATQQSFEESKDAAKAQAIEQTKQDAINTFIADFRKRWQGVTTCADDFRVAEYCDNEPEKATSTTGTDATGTQPATTSPES